MKLIEAYEQMLHQSAAAGPAPETRSPGMGKAFVEAAMEGMVQAEKNRMGEFLEEFDCILELGAEGMPGDPEHTDPVLSDLFEEMYGEFCFYMGVINTMPEKTADADTIRSQIKYLEQAMETHKKLEGGIQKLIERKKEELEETGKRPEPGAIYIG